MGDEIATAGPGTYVYKPKGIPHTFWNAGPTLARLIEIIWPGGFGHFFQKLGEAARIAASNPAEFGARAMQLSADYQIDNLPEWIGELKGRYHLKLLGEP